MKKFFVVSIIIIQLAYAGGVFAKETNIIMQPAESTKDSPFDKESVIIPPPMVQSDEIKGLLDEAAKSVEGLLTSESPRSFTMDFRMGMVNTKIYHKDGKNKVIFINKFGYPFISVYDKFVQFYSPYKNEIKEFNKNFNFLLDYRLNAEAEAMDEAAVSDAIAKGGYSENTTDTIFCSVLYSKNEAPEVKIDIALSDLILRLKNFTGTIIKIDPDPDDKNLIKLEAYRRYGGVMVRLGLDRNTRRLKYCRFYKEKVSYIAISDINIDAQIDDKVFDIDENRIAKESINYKKGLEIDNADDFNLLLKKNSQLASIDDYDEKITYEEVKDMDRDFELSIRFFNVFEPKYLEFNKKVVDLNDEEKFNGYLKEMEDFIDGEAYALEKDKNKAKAILYFNQSQFYAVKEDFKPSMRAINKSIALDPEGAPAYKRFKGKVLFFEQRRNDELRKANEDAIKKYEETQNK